MQELRIDIAALLVRASLGGMWLAHAGLKLFIFSIAGFGAWLATQGIPAWLAWPVFLVEFIGGLCVLVGWYGREVNIFLIPILLVAAWTHLGNGWVHTSAGGGWEYPVFLVAVSLIYVLIGDGRFKLFNRS